MLSNVLKRTRRCLEGVPADSSVLVAVSGGVDSTVCCELTRRLVGSERLIACLLDTGLLRKGERQEVERMFLEDMGLRIHVRDCEATLLEMLRHVSAPNEKRIVFRDLFFRELDDVASDTSCDCLVLGTQFRSPVKTYNNDTDGVGFSHVNHVVEPLQGVPKAVVRSIARELNLPHHIVNRMPFPGPGLLIRIQGEVSPSQVDLIRRATEIVETTWDGQKAYQVFPALLSGQCLRTEGNEGSGGALIALRVVDTNDQRTFSARLCKESLELVVRRLLAEPDIARVLLDLTPKPPGTVEFG